jgi:tetratricopeptide (TPR) repeat protein
MDESSQHYQQEQLTIHRRNARHLLRQAAKFGGEDRLPTHLMNDLHDTRANIARVKASLRAAGVVVVDAPEDFPAGQPDAPSAQALLDTMPIDVVPEPAPFPAFSRMPYSSNPHFIGRDDALLALAQTFKGGGRVALGPRAAATGLGGIGKTSIAAEFVHRYGQFFAGGVFWLSFADPAAVAGEVAACGGPGLLALHPAFGDLKQDDQVQLVRQIWQQETPRLLVFDNCEDPKLVEAWAPPTGGCWVLITSRRQRWPSGLRVQTQRLAVLARMSSIALLQQLAPRLTDAEADTIAEELGDLPLALQLAGSYLAQFERTKVDTYLAELTSDVTLKHPSLQGTHDEDVSLTAHDRHVGRTFLVSYQHLKPSDPIDALALKLLARAAWLAPGESIPMDLLLATTDLDGQTTEGQMAVLRLINLGLLTMEPDDTVQVHRLVHAFVGAVLQDTTALAAVEEALIDRAAVINATGYPSAMPPLVGHLRWLVRQGALRADMGMAYMCNELAFHLYVTGDYARAQPLYERVLAIREQVLGSDHPDTARSLNNLALLLQSTGDYGGALPLYERALAIQEQVLGPDHLATAHSLSSLAGLLMDIGDYDGARPLMERALVICEQVLGPNHLDTATSLNNLATLLYATGDYDGARPLYERALAITEQALRSNHPHTARSLNNLAALLYATGDYVGARPILERALAIQEQVLGPDHPDTLQCLNSLVEVLLAIRAYAETRSVYTHVLRSIEALVQPNVSLLDEVRTKVHTLDCLVRALKAPQAP